ncbi:MAG: 1-deoxy-D-xylulose-5-phosphate synthase [Oscillospiraceae bacterium]|nr:1-deoxy-D-xylulose-5-phosphate synthase [Oscillospiraceae bacterium]
MENNSDLRAVPGEQIPPLCEEIRQFLVEKVSRTGGHIASNLGMVELTVALHRVYDPEKDKILFDVGHQSYVHKLLTGRRSGFDHLRQLDGLAGFPKPCESPADPFVAGHASDSVSLAMGMARARTLQKKDFDVVAVIGDGAMTGGLSFEGLNDAGASHEPLLVILNDNGMSINESVGGISKLLRQARVRPGYLHFKREYRKLKDRMPTLYNTTHWLKENLKRYLMPPGIFEDMGFLYLGPVNGHDELALEEAIRWARELREPVLLHVVTVKGKGYSPAEENPELYHGVDAFDARRGVEPKPASDFSSCFGRTVMELAEKDEKVCAVTAAMESGTGLEGFANRFRDRFFELGIAEEHACAMCGGMASQGMKPIFAVYSTFLQRAYDMLIEDVGLMKLHVVFAVDRAGLVGRDGTTHQGSFDIAYLSSVPGMKIYAPASFAELRSMLKHAVEEETGPVAVRYPRGGEGAYTDDSSAEDAVVLSEGRDLTLVCHGILTNEAISAVRELEKAGISAELVKLNRVFPLPEETVLASLRKTGRLLSVDEACRQGSVGAQILTAAAENGIALRGVRRLDLGTGIVTHGQVEALRSRLGLDAAGIVRAAKELMG